MFHRGGETRTIASIPIHRGNSAANAEGVNHETQTTPPAAFLIALLLAGSAGVASAATTTSSAGSWYAPYVAWLQCAAGNIGACMAAGGGGGTVIPDNATPPCIKNT
ncbi:MAG: hypothetical protein OJF55_002659 [Rhodanobacteraceae bacterium]|jgi:hypothetical protein|nr:MAG: hypothetical protein OJF55_002659 [Rhodanobacteraceae bacterium]